MKEAGLNDIGIEELIQFSIHNIRPKFVKDIKDLGYKIIFMFFYTLIGELVSHYTSIGKVSQGDIGQK